MAKRRSLAQGRILPQIEPADRGSISEKTAKKHILVSTNIRLGCQLFHPLYLYYYVDPKNTKMTPLISSLYFCYVPSGSLPYNQKQRGLRLAAI